jgi:serine/threonine protein kinase
MGRVSPSDRRLRTGNRGNRMYGKDLLEALYLTIKADNNAIGSPEVFSNFPVQDSCDARISPIADIWSLGAVFSDLLVWVIAGEKERERYCRRREAEISQHSHLRSAGYDCCFHDGEQRLKSIQDFHNEVLRDKRGSDSISPLISDIILDHMLVGPRERMDAMQIRTFAARKFGENQKGNSATKLASDGMFSILTSADTTILHAGQPLERALPERRSTMPANGFSGSSLPDRSLLSQPHVGEPTPVGAATANHPNQQPNGNSTSPERVVTVKEVYPMIVGGNHRFHISRLLGAGRSKADEIMNLPGMQEARSKISENNGRDQVGTRSQ